LADTPTQGQHKALHAQQHVSMATLTFEFIAQGRFGGDVWSVDGDSIEEINRLGWHAGWVLPSSPSRHSCVLLIDDDTFQRLAVTLAAGWCWG
jgi:hypothetical protein